MLAGVLSKDLAVRVDSEGNNAAHNEPHTRSMDFTNTPIQGCIYVKSWRSKDRSTMTQVAHKRADVCGQLAARETGTGTTSIRLEPSQEGTS